MTYPSVVNPGNRGCVKVGRPSTLVGDDVTLLRSTGLGEPSPPTLKHTEDVGYATC